MALNTILTYVDGDRTSEDRLKTAIAIARQFDAHLTVLAVGYEPNMPPYPTGEAAGAMLAEMAATARTNAEKCAQSADETTRQSGVRCDVIEITCRYGVFAMAVSDHAKFADLCVLTPPYGDEAEATLTDAFEGALFNGDCAVLMCPAGTETLDTSAMMIAWNGSRESLRATRRALPLLAQAERVEVLMIDPPEERREPGHQLATMLSRHGVHAEIVAEPGTIDPVSTTLRRRALEMGAGLIVMGGYGHSRFREYMLGGATRDMLRDTVTPILMAH